MYMHEDTYVVSHQHATTTPTVDAEVHQVRLGNVTPWKGKEVFICVCYRSLGKSLTLQERPNMAFPSRILPPNPIYRCNLMD